MPRTAFILIVTADETRGQRLREALRIRAGHSCRVVGSMDDALDSIRQRAPDVVIADAQLAGQAAAPLLAAALNERAREAALFLVADGELSPADRAVAAGVLPTAAAPESWVDAVSRAAGAAVTRREDRLLQQSLTATPPEAFEGIVGVSTAIRHIIERISKAARNKLTVLILGETGTGKDLIAEAIHKRSDRAAKAFLPMNCAGLNENLLESHLFGHVKGAFTGAVTDRKGYFEAADGGTLFLDEIGDMPLPMQAKLLRTLERREITPVGSTEVRRVDVRVIAATNSDLSRQVEQRTFRDDLFYRLNQWVIRVPPLRERRDDIPVLALHLLQRANATHGVKCPGFSSAALECLARYIWPGNVREMANVIESVVVEVESRAIELDDLPEYIRGRRDIVPVTGGMVGLTMAQVERLMIERTLQATSGNREQAAKMLDIGTRTLYRKIKEYGLQ